MIELKDQTRRRENPSAMELQVRTYLESHNYFFDEEYPFEDYESNVKGRFDFLVLTENEEYVFIIEVDGQFHFKPFRKDDPHSVWTCFEVHGHDIVKNKYSDFYFISGKYFDESGNFLGVYDKREFSWAE